MNDIKLILLLIVTLGLGARLVQAEKRVSFLEGQMAGVVVTVSHEDDGTGPDYHWVENKPLHKSKAGGSR